MADCLSVSKLPRALTVVGTGPVVTGDVAERGMLRRVIASVGVRGGRP